MATGTLLRNNGAHRRRRTAVVAIALLTLSLIMTGPASAVIGGFQGDDGNETQETTTPPSVDWDNVAEQTSSDSFSVKTDSSYAGGVKEDNKTPGIVYSNATALDPKTDLKSFRLKAVGSDHLALAWDRVPDGDGSVAVNFELNQQAPGPFPTTDGQWTLNRTVGDLLLTFDFTGSGTPLLQFSRWTAAGPCAISSTNNPVANGGCWGAPTALASSDAEGSVGSGASPVFGEMVVNLRAAGIYTGGGCTDFASVTAKTRASKQFDAQLKDVVPPLSADVSNCAVSIHKVNDATPAVALAGATFSLYTDVANAPGTAVNGATCTTVADGDCTITVATPGTYWVVETTTPANHTGAAARKVIVTPAGNTPAGTQTFVNTRVSQAIRVSKTVSPSTSTETFAFSLSCTGYALTTANNSTATYPNNGGVATFDLGHGQSLDFTGIPTGTECQASETAETGWTTTVVTNGGTTATSNTSGTLTAGSTVQTAAFTNTRDTGAIRVSKDVSPSSSTETFAFQLACTNYALTNANNSTATYPNNGGVATFDLGHGQWLEFTGIPTGTECQASETAETGWTTTVVTNGGNPVTSNTSGTLTAGSSTQTAAFTNTKVTQGCVSNCGPQQTYGSLTLAKETTGGDGTFEFAVDCAGSTHDRDLEVTTTDGHGTSTTISGIPTGTSCTVTEDVPAGWQADEARQTREVNGAETITFSNTKLAQAVIAVDLAIDKIDLEDPVVVGENITYRLDVDNTGDHAATEVTVVDNLPRGVEYLSAAGDLWACGASGRVVTCVLDELKPGDSSAITVTVKTSKAGTVVNRATVSATEPELDESNNAASEDTSVNEVAGEVIERPPPAPPAEPSEPPAPSAPEPPAPPAPQPERLEVEGVQIEGAALARTGAAIGLAATIGSALLLLGLATVAATRTRRTRE